MNHISPNNGAKTPNVLCLASYEKGHPFPPNGRKLGWRVYLLTSGGQRDAGWPRQSIDQILFMAGDQSDWNLEHMLVSIAGLCPEIPRSTAISWQSISELIEAGTGANLWAEWAKLRGSTVTASCYSAREVRHEYAELPVSLARREWPDTSVFSDPEVVWKPAKRHHVGLVVSSPDDRRVAELIDSNTEIVRKDFHATVPPREKVGR